MDGWVYWGQQRRSRGSQGQQRGAEGVTEVKQMDIWGKGGHSDMHDLGYCVISRSYIQHMHNSLHILYIIIRLLKL